MKSALITGAASGIGKACAQRMAKEGYGVVVADVNMVAAEALVKELTDEGLSAIAVHMDVSNEEEVESGFDKMVDTYGSCDLVMSNAGVQIVHPFDEYPFEDWKKMMAIHADGAFLVARAAFRRMKASGKGGRIVFTGSVQSRDLGITEEEVVKNIMLRDTVDGQFTTVEDVANTLVFLSKDQGALTGQSLRLTHGWAMM